MKRNNLYLCVGIPGSGKSTWAKKNALQLNASIVSRDEIRFSLIEDGADYFSKETETYNLFVNEIQQRLNNGENVIADATHLNCASRIKLLNRLNLHGVNIIPIFFDTPLRIAMERNEKREGRARVPRSVMRRMGAQLVPPHYHEAHKYKNIIRIKEESENGVSHF